MGSSDLLGLLSRLTPRDLLILRVLADHRVLATEHIAQLAFGSTRRTQDRLGILTGLGLVERFRRYLPAGSESWRYVLAPRGAEIVAAKLGQSPPPPAKVRERNKAWAASPRLDHLLGVNGFFASLIGTARKDSSLALEIWRSERRCADEFGGIVRPDGYGVWRDHSRRLPFFLEYDTGTETRSRVTAKLNDYADLALAGEKPVLVLFWFMGRHREAGLRPMLAREAPSEVSVATGAHVHGSPGQAVWLPLKAANGRVTLGRLPLRLISNALREEA